MSNIFTGDGSFGSGLLGFGLFGKKDKDNGLNIAADPYGQTRQKFLDWLNPQIGQPGKKYEGEMVAPMSDEEKKSLDFLHQYGDQGMTDTFKNAKSEINKTLTDQYDPTTSPYYQAVKAEAARNLEQTNKMIASNAAGGGRYWSGSRLKEQREAGTDMGNRLNTLTAQEYDNERNRKMNILPQALAYSNAEYNMPLQKATAYQTLGALPRNIQQALDTAKQDEWLRSEVQYPMDIASMAMNTQTPPTYQQKPPSAGNQFMQTIGQFLPYLLMAL